MSSTNRGTVREIADYYVTPVRHIQRFLTAWAADTGEKGFYWVRNVLDPCAGGTDGREGMSYPDAIRGMPHLFPNLSTIRTIDIRNDSRADHKADYLTTEIHAPYDLIITNPPFNIAQEVIEKSLPLSQSWVIMLLRLNFLGSEKRLRFWHRNPPYRIYVHSERMKFLSHRTDLPTRERNATDSIEYAHFVWFKRHLGGPALLRVI